LDAVLKGRKEEIMGRSSTITIDDEPLLDAG